MRSLVMYLAVFAALAVAAVGATIMWGTVADRSAAIMWGDGPALSAAGEPTVIWGS
jgi:hypothetical protein